METHVKHLARRLPALFPLGTLLLAACTGNVQTTDIPGGTGAATASGATGGNAPAGGTGGNAGTPPTTGGTGGSAMPGGTGGTATAGAAGSTGGTMTTPPPVDTPPAAESAGLMPLLRLTHREYQNTIRDLLGETTNAAEGFEPDGPGNSGFETPNNVARVNAEMYMERAATLASTAMTSQKLTIPCSAPAGMAAETTCATEFVATFGRRAFRRPVTSGESTDLVALFQTARGLGFDFTQSLTHVVSEMLQSPNFLYHWELTDDPPTRDSADPALVNLTAYQLASRLSYFLWESMPDEVLLTAAANGELATPEGVAAQAARMLTDTMRGKDALFNFHRQWLHIDNLEDLAPGTTLGLELGKELQAFVSSVVLEGDGTLRSLLTAPYTFVNATTAPEYGATATGSTFTRLSLDPLQRGGILMQVPFLRTNGTAPPVDRGLVVYRQLLCGDVPPPPLVVPEVRPPQAGMTTRERFSDHAMNVCATGCHALFDPWGFSFENFDSLGHYRTTEENKPIDATGSPLPSGTGLGGVTPNGVEIPFQNAHELVAALGESEEVRWCTARQWSRYMLGRLESASDSGSIENAYKAATAVTGYSVRDFLSALTRTKAFRLRTPSAGEAL
jgi:hypothetical protein